MSNLHEMANAVVRAKELADATKVDMEDARRRAERARVAHDNAQIALEKAFKAFAAAMGQEAL